VPIATELMFKYKQCLDEDDISNYISNVTGFCHKGYVLES
jgi:hypothetical protein